MENAQRGWVVELDEYATHLATLSTASVVLLAAFSDTFGSQPWFAKAAATLAVLAFAGCIFFTIACKHSRVGAKRFEGHDQARAKSFERVAQVTLLVAVIAFVAAFLALMAFVITSIWWGDSPPSS